MRSFWLALGFLTRIPTLGFDCEARDFGRSLLYYPLVGLIIGALLTAIAFLFQSMPGAPLAAVILIAWVLVTGALHLDGLADSADAWLGGQGDTARTLDIMKDPRCGPAGVTALVLILLLKFSAIEALLLEGEWVLLMVAPLLGRAVLPLLFLTTPYVRPSGLGSAMSENIPAGWLLMVITAISLLLAFSITFLMADATVKAVIPVITSLFVFYIVRWLMLKRIAGMTGDTAGALTEICEAAVLVSLLLI